MKSIEGNFDNSEVNDLLKKHFIELRSVSPAGSTHVLDIDGLKDSSIKFWSLWEDKKLILNKEYFSKVREISIDYAIMEPLMHIKNNDNLPSGMT